MVSLLEKNTNDPNKTNFTLHMAVTTFADLNGTRVLRVGRIFAGGNCKIRQLRPFILSVHVPEIFDLFKKSAITRCTRVHPCSISLF